jgi:hypothetical protein
MSTCWPGRSERAKSIGRSSTGSLAAGGARLGSPRPTRPRAIGRIGQRHDQRLAELQHDGVAHMDLRQVAHVGPGHDRLDRAVLAAQHHLPRGAVDRFHGGGGGLGAGDRSTFGCLRESRRGGQQPRGEAELEQAHVMCLPHFAGSGRGAETVQP